MVAVLGVVGLGVWGYQNKEEAMDILNFLLKKVSTTCCVSLILADLTMYMLRSWIHSWICSCLLLPCRGIHKCDPAICLHWSSVVLIWVIFSRINALFEDRTVYFTSGTPLSQFLVNLDQCRKMETC